MLLLLCLRLKPLWHILQDSLYFLIIAPNGAIIFLFFLKRNMKVNSFSNLGLNFRGYDAVPLKALYMQGVVDRGQQNILEEMNSVASEENIDLYIFDDTKMTTKSSEVQHSIWGSSRWAQDRKIFLEKNGERKIIWNMAEPTFNKNVLDFFPSYSIEKSDSSTPAGGNFFLGKNSKGEKWLLIGRDNVESYEWKTCKDPYKKTIPELSKFFGIKEENIFVLEQPYFHLDMAIRPVGFPYVLVDDPKLGLKNLEKIEKDFPQNKDKIRKVRNYLERRTKSWYSSTDETCKKLIEYGFKPIRIAGSYTEGINFMNAIVNLKDNGKMSYITNSPKHTLPFYEKLEEIFKKDLVEACPDIDKIYMVSGKMAQDNRNDITHNLEILHGGIHCMTAEVPDFDKIA